MNIPNQALLAMAALALVLAQPAAAQTVDKGLYRGGFQYNDMGATPPAGDSLYKDLGGEEKIAAFTKDFVDMISTDPQIGHYFAKVNLEHLTKELTDQFIDLSGGPVKYTGADMGTIHQGMGVTNADFNKLAELLQIAMDKHDVPFATQNRLVALLASMQRVVVTK